MIRGKIGTVCVAMACLLILSGLVRAQGPERAARPGAAGELAAAEMAGVQLAATCPNLEGCGNTASGDYSTVGGGILNGASAKYACVGGGTLNTASGESAAVGGGTTNTASGAQATVGGGNWNQATGATSTVGGGTLNTAEGQNATVGGGKQNKASGNNATVPGGKDNLAKGIGSLAAGVRAKANHDGAFVWADMKPYNFASTGVNQFSVRSTGGARFVSAVNASGGATAGVVLSAGAGSWSTLSDRALKEHLQPVDGVAVLEQVAAMPVYTWNYAAQGDDIRHMGPMAQDFAALGLGEEDTLIATVDADGAALAAIQGLYALVRQLQEENAALQARVAALEGE